MGALYPSRASRFVTSALFAACVAAFGVSAALGQGSAIVISEFRSQGPGGSNDDFVELYNRTCDQVDLAGWRIRINGVNRPTIGSIQIPGHRHLLIGSPSYTGGPPWADFLDTFSIPSSCCIELVEASGLTVDAVGTADLCAHEGDALPVYQQNVDWSYERKQGGTAGNLQDTDDNLTDFQRISPSYPENLASPAAPPCGVACDPCDANCDGSVNQFDITPFVNAVATHHGCSECAADTNGDGTANTFDINTFLDCLIP